MSYPQAILPRPEYRKISCNLSDYFLLRVTGNSDIWHFSTGKLTDEALYVAHEKQFLDYSTNLLGLFMFDFCVLRIDGENKDYFIEDWQEGESVKAPEENKDFIICQDNSGFCVNIGKISGKKAPFKRTDKCPELEAECYVQHRPTRSNFWHFEILLLDEKREPISKKNMSAWKKDLIRRSLKIWLKHYAKKHTDIQHQIRVLPDEEYKN